MCSVRMANILVVWIPWGISWVFYTGNDIGVLLAWGGVLLTSAKECNRPTAPLLELILKKTFKKRHRQVLCIFPAYHHSLVSKYEQFV
jgi:hypothetical protein